MDNLDFYVKSDQKLMYELQVKEVDRFIARTEKGDLRMCLRQGGTKYYFTLDNLPVAEATSTRLMDMIGYATLKSIYGTKPMMATD